MDHILRCVLAKHKNTWSWAVFPWFGLTGSRSGRSSADGLLLIHPDFTKQRRWLQTTALLNLSRISGNVDYCQQNRGRCKLLVYLLNSFFEGHGHINRV